MAALLLAAALGASCEHPRLATVPLEQRDAACQLLGQAPGPETAGATQASLADIFARPGFERARQRSSGALQAFLAQARAWLRSLFESSGAETYSNVTRVAVLAVALAVGLGVVLRLARRRAPRPAPGVAPAARPLVLDAPEAHHERALALLDAAPREALREGLLALLAALERRRLARPERVKTNRELVAELEARGAPAELVAAVRPLVERFDRAWYSLAAVTGDEARRFLAEVKAVTG